MTEFTARRPSRRAVVLTLLALSLVIELFAFKALSKPKQIPLEVLGLQIVNDSGPATTAEPSETSPADSSPSSTEASSTVGPSTAAPGGSTNPPSTEAGTQNAGIGGALTGPISSELPKGSTPTTAAPDPNAAFTVIDLPVLRSVIAAGRPGCRDR